MILPLHQRPVVPTRLKSQFGICPHDQPCFEVTCTIGAYNRGLNGMPFGGDHHADWVKGAQTFNARSRKADPKHSHLVAPLPPPAPKRESLFDLL